MNSDTQTQNQAQTQEQHTSNTAPASPQATMPQDKAAPQVTPGTIHPADEALLKQGVNHDELRALQEGIVNPSRSIQEAPQPHYPGWPTSVPGPRSTPPPPGMRPINAIRPEQVVEVGYNQETGEPSTTDPRRALPDASQGPTSPDLPTAQDALKRGKVRLE